MNELVNHINPINPILNQWIEPWIDPDPVAGVGAEFGEDWRIEPWTEPEPVAGVGAEFGEDWIMYNDPIPTIVDLEDIRNDIEQNTFINNTPSNIGYMTELLLKAKKNINNSFNDSV